MQTVFVTSGLVKIITKMPKNTAGYPVTHPTVELFKHPPEIHTVILRQADFLQFEGVVDGKRHKLAGQLEHFSHMPAKTESKYREEMNPAVKTGFDVPSLHTMYIDKPMRGHGLMQAIARVNRVYKDKPGGLIVDYLGIAHEIKKALAEYSDKDKGETGIDQDVAVGVLLEKYEVAKAMFHGFDYNSFFKGTPQEKVRIVPAAMEHILAQQDGKKRFVEVVAALSKAFALSVPHQKALNYCLKL